MKRKGQAAVSDVTVPTVSRGYLWKKDWQRNKTIKISRYKESQQGIRCDSKKLIDAVAMIIKSLPDG